MARRHDMTTMGGGKSSFRTTCWTQIAAAGADDEVVRQAVFEGLFRAYWRPVYCYLRRKGDSNEQAKDLTQGFFQEIMLRGKLLAHADRGKGRFRTFLLTALEHYRTNVHEKATAQKRRPEGSLFSLAEFDTSSEPEPPGGASPAEAYNYAWACKLLDEVIRQVHEECFQSDKETHWNVFHDRVLVPILDGTRPPALEEICARHNVETEATASNMIITVKRRFHNVLKRCLSESLGPEVDVEEELRELLVVFSRHGAG